MKKRKTLPMFFAVTLVILQFALSGNSLFAQSFDGVKTGIGGSSTVASSDNSLNDIFYIAAGAVVVGAALYFYIKWYNKKLGKTGKKANLNSGNILVRKTSRKFHLPVDLFLAYKKGNETKNNTYFLGFYYNF
jgi:3-phosphoglycerate kinase